MRIRTLPRAYELHVGYEFRVALKGSPFVHWPEMITACPSKTLISATSLGDLFAREIKLHDVVLGKFSSVLIAGEKCILLNQKIVNEFPYL